MRDMFAPVTRDERQAESVQKWLSSKGKGTIVACTGYGKTRVAINCIERVLAKYPTLTVLIVVPTDTLLKQWVAILDDRGLSLNTKVQIINTTAKNGYECDILVIDEIHRVGADTFKEVFNKVKYKHILGLTATIERLDGKHEIIEKHCPVIDEISIEVARVSGWVSDFVEYQVIISPEDIDLYRQYNKDFNEHFEFFNYDFGLVMSELSLLILVIV